MTTTPISKEGRTSVLAALTAEVMAEKKGEARKLTPVAGEKGHLPLETAELPHDTGTFMSNEILFAHAKELRQFAADAIVIADGLDGLLNESSKPDAGIVDLDVARKAKEAEGDAKAKARTVTLVVGTGVEAQSDPLEVSQTAPFAADFAAKAAAAQAATFTPKTGWVWVCPDHDVPGIDKVSGKGREFIGCPDCNQFKR